MRLLLILGAGASRNLAKGQDQMPLMADWSKALSHALDSARSGLAAACHLTGEMDGQQFEENLGLLLQWEKVRSLEERFEMLGSDDLQQVRPAIGKARENQSQNLETVRRVINQTLYDQFGHERLDDNRAKEAYALLLEALGDPELLIATTNYDRAVETALEHLGVEIETGFPRRPGRTPILDPVGLVDDRNGKVPIIHLHGAVGWYDTGEDVKDHPPDLPFNPTLGRPVVLYPDPDKDPVNESFVDQLWGEFAKALEVSEGVLVIGHSLHDPALVDALVRQDKTKPLIVTHIDKTGAEEIKKKLPSAKPVHLDFGPRMKSSRPLRDLLQGEESRGSRKSHAARNSEA